MKALAVIVLIYVGLVLIWLWAARHSNPDTLEKRKEDWEAFQDYKRRKQNKKL